jgi:hypothetical protein
VERLNSGPYYESSGGDVACLDHIGTYADADARRGAARIVTPLATWHKMTAAEVREWFATCPQVCTTCWAHEMERKRNAVAV